ncbi:MAG: VOC family protein [Acidimicrobiales bacterium]
MILRPGNIVFDTQDVARLARFWAEVTGYEPRPLFGTYAGLRDPSGRGANITFQRVEDAEASSSNCHVDFYAKDPDEVARRAVELGAQLVRRVNEAEVSWIVLTDPDGNEFCVVSAVGSDREP